MLDIFSILIKFLSCVCPVKTYFFTIANMWSCIGDQHGRPCLWLWIPDMDMACRVLIARPEVGGRAKVGRPSPIPAGRKLEVGRRLGATPPTSAGLGAQHSPMSEGPLEFSAAQPQPNCLPGSLAHTHARIHACTHTHTATATE